MAGISVAVNISGDAKFMSKLSGLMPALLDWTEALDKAGSDMVAYFSEQPFKSQGGVFGTPWAALSPRTIAIKSELYREYAAQPLIATTTMKNSFEHSATSTHLEVTNSAPYFVYHQSTAPRHKIPRRPMFAVNDDVKGIIQDAFESNLATKIGGLI